MTGALLVATALLAGWVVASWLPVRGVGEPAYRVVETRDGYEIREYEPHVVAETHVSGDADEARNEGFRRLAGYIFGGNVESRKLSMTAPVLSADEKGREIPMTAPVLAGSGDGGIILSFIMPEGETLESLPQPKDKSVVLRSVGRRRAAVTSVPLHPSGKKVEDGKKRLAQALRRDGIAGDLEVSVAYYNPPWTIPFMRRTEIIAWLPGEAGSTPAGERGGL